MVDCNIKKISFFLKCYTNILYIMSVKMSYLNNVGVDNFTFRVV